jgi:hypothetical protein
MGNMLEASANQSADVDMSNAVAIVEHLCPDGTVIRGYLNENAVSVFAGRPLLAPPGHLLDMLYRAEVDGRESLLGLWTNLHDFDPTCRAVDFLMDECGIRLPGVDRRPVRPNASRDAHASSSPSVRRRRWPTLLCEIIHDMGGHADMPSIIDAIQCLPESEEGLGWQEETMQALKVHRVPHGRQYFDVADVGGHEVFVLTEFGHAIVRRRFQDDRVPSLSKYLAKAIDEEDGAKRLTDIELYTMLFLATRLGRARDATTIFHRLPQDFPNEDSYAVIPLWIEQAEHMETEER